MRTQNESEAELIWRSNRTRAKKRMLPNFLGIGVPKAGSTWLYELLKSHPDIYVPPSRREVRFLTQVPERTLSWYEDFFPDDDGEYSATGEVTPHYLYCSNEQLEFLRREIPSADRFILILRHPVDRVYSHYWFRRRTANLDLPFSQFIEKNEGFLEKSRYVEPIERWFEHFDREQFLILVFEEDLPNPVRTRRKLADFLGVECARFPEEAGQGTENERYLPALGGLYRWATDVAERLRKTDMDWLVHLAKRAGVKHMFGKKRVGDREMDSDVRTELENHLLGQVDRLEELTGKDLSVWKDS